jgi:energy-coupling factor transporter ATP-binding protein EcfA2
MPEPIAPVADLRAALHALEELVGGVHFELPGDAGEQRNGLKDEIIWGINEYLEPRLGDLESPLIAVLIGSTGSGKSTILNSLAGKRISKPGAIRPTTTQPVVWAHRNHADRYREDFLSGYGSAERPIEVVAEDEAILEGLTAIDAPDFDSVVEHHRQIADDLLAIGDIIIFVTSAQRYADAVPWEFLEKALIRAVPVLFVANRIPAESGEIVNDYRRLLEERGFDLAGRFFEIAEQEIGEDTGGLPDAAVAGLRAQLHGMADRSGRSAVLDASIRGAVGALSVRTSALRQAIVDEGEEADALRNVAAEAYERQIDEVSRSLRSGDLIREEVIDRWQEYVGTGELTKAISDGVSRVSSWAKRVFGGSPTASKVRTDAGLELRDVLIRRADLAATAAASAWELDTAGANLLGGRALWRHAKETEQSAGSTVENWLVGVSELIGQAGASKKRTAVVASYGVNSVAVAVILGVFLQTGGLTGAEVGVAAGAAAAQQKLLEHLFGSAAARSLIETAGKRIEEAAGDVLREDGARFDRLVDEHTRALVEPSTLTSKIDRVLELTEAWDGP